MVFLFRNLPCMIINESFATDEQNNKERRLFLAAKYEVHFLAAKSEA